MTLPAAVPLGYNQTIKNETGGGADHRKHYLYLNDTEGADVDVAIQFTDVDDEYGDAGIIEVFNSAGLIVDKYVASASGASCELTIPDGGKLLIRAQTPTVRCATAISLSDRLLSETGTNGDNLHDYSATLLTTSGGLVSAADPIPAFDSTPASVPDEEEPLVCTEWRADMISQAAWILDNMNAQGGIDSPYYGSNFGSFGYGEAMLISSCLSFVHTVYCEDNPYYGGVADRAKAAMFFELSRALENGGLNGWDGYTGFYGLSNAGQIPTLAIETFYEGMSASEKTKVRNAIQIIGHANCILTIESAANQSYHFVDNFANFIRCWKHIRSIDGETDGDIYDYTFGKMVEIMLGRTGYVMGVEGLGRAAVEAYGFSYSYGGLQRAGIVNAIHALVGDDDLADYRTDLIDFYDDQERFFDFARVCMADGTQLVANGYDARQVRPLRQYGRSDSMRGISAFPSRQDQALTNDPTTPVARSTTIEYRNWYSQRLNLEIASPITDLDPEPIPSTLRTEAYSSNGYSAWYRNANHFIGLMPQCVWDIESAASRVNGNTSGDTDGERIGQPGEMGGPFSAAVENGGTNYETELDQNESGCLSGQGGIEAMAIRGIAVMANRNISPLTVHGIFGIGDDADDPGTDRYYTADPHSQDSTIDWEAGTMTTTFELYLITGTFTRVIDWSDPEKVTVSITAPSDPGGSITLIEVVPLIDDDDLPSVKQIAGFSPQNHAVFGTEDGYPNIKRMQREVSWGETLVYSIEEHPMSSIDFTENLVHHYEFNETAANSAPGGDDFADSVGSAHLTDGGTGSYNDSAPANLGGAFTKTSDADHPPRVAFGDLDWNFETGEDFTISIWIKMPATWSTFDRIWSFSDEAQGKGVAIKMRSTQSDPTYGGKIYFRMNSLNRIFSSASTLEVVPDEWNHIVLTHETGVGTSLYINGELSDTDNYTTQITPIDDNGLAILGYYGSGATMVEGAGVAQFSIWNRLFDSDDVDALYGSGDGLAFTSFGSNINAGSGSLIVGQAVDVYLGQRPKAFL